MSILAYNGLVIGAGAGGLAYSTGNGAGGAATVIDVAGPAGGDAAAAKLERTAVSGFDDLSVRALSAARIANIAAAFAVARGEAKTALSAGISVNLISFDTTALIDTGATGLGLIDVGGAVQVFAGDDNTAPDTSRGLLGNYSLGDTLGSDDPVDASQLQGGTRILSIAVPVAAGGKNGAGVGFAWNSIDNDRTAKIVGGGRTDGTAAIKAASVSVKAVDHSDILALATGVGAGKGGVGLLGSVTRNIISGSSAATLGRSVGATSNLVVNVAAAPGSVPNVAVGASGDGGIFSLAGAIGIGKKGAAGLSVGVNDIVREKKGVATNAGLQAAIDGVSFSGTPDVAVTADATGKILGNAISLAAATNGAAFAGAASANNLAPNVSATAARVNYLNATTGDLKIAASDTSAITSTALVAGIGKDGGAAVGVSVNRIDADVKARLQVAAGDRIDVRNLVVNSLSTASTKAFGLGAGGGKTFGGAGSIAVNLTNSDVTSTLGYTGGAITTTGSIGVVARRDLTIDVGAGAIAVGANAAIGASVIVNDLGGSADARIEGNVANTGKITAFTGSGDDSARTLTGLRTGGLNKALPQFDGLDGFKDLALAGMVDAGTGSYKGVAVNASSTAATRTLALTGALAGSGVAIGVTGVVNNTTGSTNASISNANVQVGSDTVANQGIGIDVRASSQQVGLTFAGAIAASGKVAAAAPIVSDGYAGRINASITGGNLTSAGTIAAKAIANQSSTALVAAAAVAGNAALSVAAVSPRFQSNTSALIDRPSGIKALGTGGVAVNADSNSRALATFVTVAGAGNGAGAAAVVVATNENKTSAAYKGAVGADGLGSVAVDAAKLDVIANGDFSALIAGASAAASATFALVGNGVGVVHRGEVSATADALKYDKAAGAVTVKAAEQVAIAPVVGQVSLTFNPASGSAALGAIAVLSQSKVDATLSRPSVVARDVVVDAKGYNQVNALQLGVAVGGVGIGANVTYIGVGAVSDTGALTKTSGDGSSDEKIAGASGSTGGGNANLTQMQRGGGMSGAGVAGQTANATTSAEKASVAGNDTGRNAFTSVASPGDASAARVRAQVTGTDGTGQARVAATNLTIDSDANLLSKSTNIQASLGIVAGSAAIGITRNAAESIAYLGNVNASGGTLTLNATTGEAAGTNGITLKSVSGPTVAAQADILAGSVGVGALTVGVADVALSSAAVATVDTAKVGLSGNGTINFTTANIGAYDTTNARADAVGVAAGAAAINVIVANAAKTGNVTATMAGTSSSDVVAITADGRGGASASSKAGSGGIIFAGNAAVALASDQRTIRAIVAEGATMLADTIKVKALSTPVVSASSLGVAVSGGFAAGASIATAKSGGTVEAKVGERGRIEGALSLTAQTLKPAGDNVSANAIGSAGGYATAVNGSVALAETSLTTNAIVGANLDGSVGGALVQIGDLTVDAKREIGQSASATGVTFAGVLAVGVQRAESKSGGDTRAAIENVDGSSRSYVTGTGLR